LKKTLVLVKGNVHHPAGLIQTYWNWFRIEQRLRHGSRYDILELIAPSRETLLDSLSDCRAAVLYGHGSSDGRGFVLNVSRFRHGATAQELLDDDFLYRLAKVRTAPLDFVYNASCFGAKRHEHIAAWLQVTDLYVGFARSTFSVLPHEFSLPKAYHA
jgi:hypothetical protein